jgi:nucleotide-binding universal stress UspA family protein
MRIVVGVDGSRCGRWALQWIQRLPLRTAPRITAVHAVDLADLRAAFMPQPTVIGNQSFIRDEVKRIENRAKQVVADTKRTLSSSGFTGTVRSERGSVSNLIVKHGRKGGLIVVGCRGLDAMDRVLLGSVSTQVTLHAPCSVLVVKQPPKPVRRLLLAIDGSQASHKTVAFLTRAIKPKVKRSALEVLAVHVNPFFTHPEIKQATIGLTHAYARKLTKAGYRVTEMVRKGQPADEILTLARQQHPDLIVCGAKGLGAIGRFFLGSVSTKLIQRSPYTVLVVR